MRKNRVLLVAAIIVIALTWVTPAFADATHVVRWGENLTMIARRYRVTVQQIVDANGLRSPSHIFAGQKLRIPGVAADSGNTAPSPITTSGTHVVRRGETLGKIARDHGTSVEAFVRANGLRNANYIWVGQRLVIPGYAGTPSSSGTPAKSKSPYQSYVRSYFSDLEVDYLKKFRRGSVFRLPPGLKWKLPLLTKVSGEAKIRPDSGQGEVITLRWNQFRYWVTISL